MSIMSNAKRAFAVAAAAATLFSMAACGSSNADSNTKSDSSAAASSGKIEVVASINQWGSVAADLGGDNVEVTNIMTKTNVEAHDYEPTAADVAKFGSAKVAVVNGADYDPWASKAAGSTNATLVDAAETAGIKEGDNPHVWFSAEVRSATADAITAAYQKADPDNKDDYAQLNKDWHAKEDKLESKIKETSAKTANLPYAATESVAWYLADDLKMSDATPKGYAQASANESEPTPADIKDFQDALKGGSIKMLVFNSQEANSTTDQITGAAKDANVPIVELTEQMPSEYDNLLDWMDALVDQFAAAVK
ncbi:MULTISPECIES: metal ABC transporter solute-binding protein [unclassified Bifidobacterium]|uniref:metal ABC transporter solute-binding protein n=1 Tax=unclassified Bifidobacterium TaxID=2608897 RepID=UPI00112CDB0E|nr:MULTISPECIES: metal ABC transporter solute-binding protein [unclassified Bifidobacterium]TPF77668.1 ABC transporter substrate-binding protein [Bifidobacterium sp. UTCIF-1]TPF79519.1 ABC transporter substrate-binding protein [Bifidobacterium sp. UTCIF-24]TPF81779.1 ABC transporter substrate-binding protein [Bifidobacterium sp. UTCIF-3]TPF83533.1 ABC transporter substrate-binding protein [Bifidobacterium sp. UTCIF-36]TPF88304.1 ABC transporter substrate-binding protein [Bifidobacterium sp. UT